MLVFLVLAVLVVAVGAAAVAHQHRGRPHSGDTPALTPPAEKLQVVGTHIETGTGQVVQFRGVNRSGTEYECLSGQSVFVGPADLASVQAMLSWHINVVRLPLNEDCWLGINGYHSKVAGRGYRDAIAAYVSMLDQHGISVIVDLHWSASGRAVAGGQEQMPDLTHAPAFWKSVAATFSDEPNVMFELYNEPYGVSWQCWRDGCEVPATRLTPAYAAVGMQQLTTAIRDTGANNIVIADGLQHATDFSEWDSEAPFDPLHRVVAGWHLYAPTGCAESCWQATVNAVDAPVLVTEFGQLDCGTAFDNAFMPWLDARDIGYLAWSWNLHAGCGGPALLDSYAGTPKGAYGEGIYAHLHALP